MIARLLQLKWLVFTCLVLPGVWPLVPLVVTANPTLLAEPTKYVLHHMGFVALVLVVVVLCFTPLRVLFPKAAWTAALQRHRRRVGVASFVYACLHLGMYFVHEGGGATFATDWSKPFILVGLVTFAILLVLAVTSWNGAVRWLGPRRWKWLHRLVYVALILAALHQIWARKVFPMQVVWLLAPLLAIEVARMVRLRAQRSADA